MAGLAVLVGLMSSVVPYSLELLSLRRLSAETSAVLTFISPATAAVAGWLVLDQQLGCPGIWPSCWCRRRAWVRSDPRRARPTIGLRPEPPKSLLSLWFLQPHHEPRTSLLCRSTALVFES